MTEYFPTHEGRVQAIIDTDLILDINKAEVLLAAIDEYAAQFAYKCHSSFCPQRRSGYARAKWSDPGFPTRDELELHWVRDHENHHLTEVRRNGLGWIHFNCACGHHDGMFEEDYESDDQEPEGRRIHLDQVEYYRSNK